MKKAYIFVFSFLIFSFSVSYTSFSQIEDIKDKSTENKNDSDKNNNENNSSDPGDGIMDACFGACFEVGCSFFIGFIGEYSSHLYTTKETDPSILSLDINANFALGYQFSSDKTYQYVNYLPGLRANILAFIIDFRYNILTEYTDDFPDSFKSWHLDVALNIAPVETFKIGIGTGVHAEM